MANAIGRIAKRLGYDKAKFALNALADKNYNEVVAHTLMYYDKCYLKGLQKRQKSAIFTFEIPTINSEATADFLINLNE